MTARNAVIFINVLLVTALFVHLKFVLWDKSATAAGPAALTHLPDELYDEHQPDESSPDAKGKPLKANSGIKARRTAVVVASQSSENATWLEEYFPEWEKNIYRVDDANAPLSVPKNKGRESMVYLTYVLGYFLASEMHRKLMSDAGSATSSTTTNRFPTMSSSSTQTATNGTTTIPTTTASPCSATSSCLISRNKATSTYAAHGLWAARARSIRLLNKANTGRPCMLADSIRRLSSSYFLERRCPAS
jgi:hypothetical protein